MTFSDSLRARRPRRLRPSSGMGGVLRMLLGSAVAVLMLATLQGSLHAGEDVPPAVRDEVELLWLAGRLEAIDAYLANYQDGSFAGRWPILLRDHFWRAGGPPPEDAHAAGLSADEAALHAPALAWLRASAQAAAPDGQPPRPFPAWSGGGDDPYPILRALVQDRQRREQRGHSGLPEDSPLMRLAEELTAAGQGAWAEALSYYTEIAMQRAYTGKYEYNPAYAAEDRQAEASANALLERNGRWAFWSLLAFILIPIGLGLRLRTRSG